MSASQIPNLNTLRRGGPRLRGGRGRGGSGVGGEAGPRGGAGSLPNKDEVIRKTDLDASTSRLSAVETGYLDDPFAKLLTANGEAARRLPLMNRGTYVRTTAIDRLVESFCESAPKRRKQIISLGAGSDTRFFRLKSKYPDLDLVYHELDFPTNASRKIRMLQTLPARNTISKLANWNVDTATISHGPAGGDNDVTELHSTEYHIHPVDLRSLPGASLHQNQSAGSSKLADQIDATLPTLLISECCLIYLSPSDAEAVVSYFSSLFSSPSSHSLGIIIYEPIRPHDAFGRTMVSNLIARGIHLQTLNSHATLGAQRSRLHKHNFNAENGGGAGAADVDFIWQSWIDSNEKQRVEALEWMDEVEEWRLLMQHYCVAWGWRRNHNDDEDVSAEHTFAGWKSLANQPVDS